MQTGYVTLLDVLGFSSLVSSEGQDKRIDEYLRALQAVLENRPSIEYLVFSIVFLLRRRMTPKMRCKPS